MDNADISPQFKTTSLSVPSPNAAHVACLSSTRLQIRCLSTFEVVRSAALPSDFDCKKACIAWSPPLPSAPSTPRSSRPQPPASNRVLVFDENTTRVYDLRDDKWSAVISNGSGGMGKNVHVEFGAGEDEVLVWSDFAACVKVWCLRTGRAVEVRDPKFAGRDGRGWGFRPSDSARGGGVLAMLCRSSGQDILLLLAPRTHTLLRRTELPTVDAAGLKWSRDGRWLAIWDAPSAGHTLCIYTADGHLYRTLSREPSEQVNEWGVEGLGIKSVEWVPGNEWLAVGGWDRRVRILSTRTFTPVVFLDHTASIHVPTAPVFTETVDAQGNRSYFLTTQPATPPKAPAEKSETGVMKQGISVLAFNGDGTLYATRDDSTPTTVWIWDLRSLRPRTILIQHAPIKSLQWHNSHLLIQTAHDSPTVYLCTAENPSHEPPAILALSSHISKPASSLPAKWSTTWLSTPADKKPVFALAHQQGYVLVWPDGKDQILRFEREDEAEQSDDSLYEILTGRTPVPRFRGSQDIEREDVEESIAFEDTFRGKGVPDGRGESCFDESGLDEMF
ncbi:TolB, C-terminal domain-containing protein [Dothidotthia symphoricarpi CBS 119687]|uniref:TolB, C-terminal domain-containing protein n=1 Tax=Dothidotthia symphoricarpi CBS 119687 TaxID=1392245 RepID=A0A6A5ZYN3_9PLEO|nr:TolB, C-terminal domain-containing protein [Dothidotthia symphoricarpi CBS 119687]KAF2124700.1 TolB, C-terminal domain-containing protein [Dothidotthia symphoricarpi CBS 119687]